MKIVPVDSTGEPVDILSINGGNGSWDLTVSCHTQHHRITLTQRKELTIHNHTNEQIKDEEIMAGLADDVGKACPCVRIKLWLSKGIYIIHVMP